MDAQEQAVVKAEIKALDETYQKVRDRIVRGLPYMLLTTIVGEDVDNTSCPVGVQVGGSIQEVVNMAGALAGTAALVAKDAATDTGDSEVANQLREVFLAVGQQIGGLDSLDGAIDASLKTAGLGVTPSPIIVPDLKFPRMSDN